jgi:hypothetical protein
LGGEYLSILVIWGGDYLSILVIWAAIIYPLGDPGCDYLPVW